MSIFNKQKHREPRKNEAQDKKKAMCECQLLLSSCDTIVREEREREKVREMKEKNK